MKYLLLYLVRILFCISDYGILVILVSLKVSGMIENCIDFCQLPFAFQLIRGNTQNKKIKFILQ